MDAQTKVNRAAELFRGQEWLRNGLLAQAPAHLTPLICHLGYLQIQMHKIAGQAVIDGDIPAPQESEIALPPAPVPADMEGGGGK